jgi:ATP-dependent helicase HrpA
MILAAREENVVEDVLIIASALSVQDPRDRPLENPDAADQAHAKFRDETSDFLTFLHLWNWFHEQEKHLSGSKLRKACRANFISYMRMREWRDVHEQLRELVMEMGLHRPANPQAPAAPRRARKRAARRR